MNNKQITYVLVGLVTWAVLLTAAFVLVTIAQVHFNRDTMDIMEQMIDLIKKLQ